MSLERFLEYDVLQHRESSTGFEDELFRLGETVGDASSLFSFYEEAMFGDDEIDKLAHKLREAFVPPPNTYSSQYRNTRRPIVRFPKLREIAAVTLRTSVLEHLEAVHIHDACSGTGVLSTSIAHLRGVDQETSATCWDSNPLLAGKQASIASLLLGNRSEFLRFVPTVVANADFSHAPDRKTLCLAKHPCGEAADAITSNIAKTEQPPDQTVILTCCHGKVSSDIPSDIQTSQIPVSLAQWRILKRVAEWTNHKLIPFRTIGRVAMRIIDCLRVMALPPNLRGRVEEIVHPKDCFKNHALVIEPI